MLTQSQGNPGLQRTDQSLERTCFQTGRPYSDRLDLRADVAIVYGIGSDMPSRVESWRSRGYRVHLMTGVAWGEYQDYLYGRFDGVNHEDEVQTEQSGNKIGHGGDVYYMSPGADYGKYLAAGVRKALDSGVEAVHLEEPEFWVRGGYGAGFKREWKAYYGEDWQPPDSSVDARWRASKLMYYLYRRALQQVFDSVLKYNREHHTSVRCYVPTHSLPNYAHWRIVSPESSLARLKGCDGYIAQVWTGTARTPNVYRGVKKERTFETAFLEYGAMQNLVRATGRRVWYLADPVEDDPNHDWGDYRRNWQATLAASLLQPEVWRYEVMPWPERIWTGAYPSEGDPSKRVGISSDYATELQVVINALKNMRQRQVRWDAGTRGIGVAVSDSLMFERGDPTPSDGDMSHFYGLAMPFVKRGMPVQPIQLENVNLPGYLDSTRLLLISYQGMKPLGPEAHEAIAAWVKKGGLLMFVDRDDDPYLGVREWWNTGGRHYKTPREHLFELLGLDRDAPEGEYKVGLGAVSVVRRDPSDFARDPRGDQKLVAKARSLAELHHLPWEESNHLVLRRGPYVVAASLDESTGSPLSLQGHFVDLFDPELRAKDGVELAPGTQRLLVDLDRLPARSASVIGCSASVDGVLAKTKSWSATLEGVSATPCLLTLKVPGEPSSVKLDGHPVATAEYDPQFHRLAVRFENTAKPRRVEIRW